MARKEPLFWCLADDGLEFRLYVELDGVVVTLFAFTPDFADFSVIIGQACGGVLAKAQVGPVFVSFHVGAATGEIRVRESGEDCISLQVLIEVAEGEVAPAFDLAKLESC